MELIATALIAVGMVFGFFSGIAEVAHFFQGVYGALTLPAIIDFHGTVFLVLVFGVLLVKLGSEILKIVDSRK